MESFPILRFFEVTFRNLNIFWVILFNLNDVVRHYCDVTTLTEAFYDLRSKKKTYVQKLICQLRSLKE